MYIHTYIPFTSKCSQVLLSWTNEAVNVTRHATVLFNAYPERSTLAPCSTEELDTYNAACLKVVNRF